MTEEYDVHAVMNARIDNDETESEQYNSSGVSGGN